MPERTPEHSQLSHQLSELILNLILLPPEKPKDEQQAMARRLYNQTDLGCVLVASSHIEDQLAKLLKAYFRRSETAIKIAMNDDALDKVFDGHDAFIIDFSHRTRLAYALGLITQDTKKSLDVFRREIRNMFAHKISDKHTISDQMTTQVIQKMDADKQNTIKTVADLLGRKLLTPRHRFTFYAVLMWTELHQVTVALSQSSPAAQLQDDSSAT